MHHIFHTLWGRVTRPKAVVAAILIPAFLATATSLFFRDSSIANAAPATQTCGVITLISGTSTQTAGFSTSTPVASPLEASLYSNGSFSAAAPTETVIPPWLDPATVSPFAGSGAVWVSSSSTWPGGNGNTEGTSTSDQWRLFKDSFTLPAGATATSATLWFAADNAVAVYMNGNSSPIATTNGSSTEDVYGPTPVSAPNNYGSPLSVSLSPTEGNNTLSFVVRNWGGYFSSNPTGLVYKAMIPYCTTNPGTVAVTIQKFIDGHTATSGSAMGLEFPVSATWNATNTGSGSGTSTLNANNNPVPYQIKSSEMTAGGSFSVLELMNGSSVGTACDGQQPFALTGYTTGDSMESAASANPTTTNPMFSNLTNDKYVIVWNRTCTPPTPTSTPPTSTSTVKVHLLKYLDGTQATASSSVNYQFPMMATWQTDNLNGGATTTGNFVLGNNHGGAANQYGADTSAMDSPAYYSASESVGGNIIAPNGTCVPGAYRLKGYSTSSSSFASAAAMPIATTAPTFMGLTSDAYIIVWNEHCTATSTTATSTKSIKQGIITDILTLRNSLTNQHDKNALLKVTKDIEKSLTNSFWTDSDHLSVPKACKPKQPVSWQWGEDDLHVQINLDATSSTVGSTTPLRLWHWNNDPRCESKVFQWETRAVSDLQILMKSKHGTLSNTTLQGFIDRLVAVDRKIAMTAIDDATAAGGIPLPLSIAHTRISQGDAAAAGGKFLTAISDYQQAWSYAIKSMLP